MKTQHSKNNVSNWETVNTYGATYPNGVEMTTNQITAKFTKAGINLENLAIAKNNIANR